MERQVDWLVNSSLTGPIFSRALNLLTQLEIFLARDKDWPVNDRYRLFSTVVLDNANIQMQEASEGSAVCRLRRKGTF